MDGVGLTVTEECGNVRGELTENVTGKRRREVASVSLSAWKQATGLAGVTPAEYWYEYLL